MDAHLCWAGRRTQELPRGPSPLNWQLPSPGPERTDGSIRLAWKSETELFLGLLLSPAQSNCGKVIVGTISLIEYL